MGAEVCFIAATMVRLQLSDAQWTTVRGQLEAERGASVGCVAVIAATASRIPALPDDKALYKARTDVECTFNLLKQARRFATRYEKTSVGRHDRIANAITVFSPDVRRAIRFHYQPVPRAVEVGDVKTDGLLAPELQPGETTAAQQLP